MKRFFEVFAVIGFSFAVTLVVLAVVGPAHPRLEAAGENLSAVVAPAIFIPGLHERSGNAESVDPLAPAAPRPLTGCPFLDSRAAAEGCPAMTDVTSEKACPYLEELRRKARDEKPRPRSGLHT